jgi:histidine triad (HIT) family protein
MDCLFCKIIKGEIPSYKIYEDESTYAFLDISPTTRGHTLVIPKVHAVDIQDIDSESLAAVAKTSKYISKLLVDKLGADGINLRNNSGKVAHQDVFHFHMHVLPRYKNDGLNLTDQKTKEINNEEIDLELLFKELT